MQFYFNFLFFLECGIRARENGHWKIFWQVEAKDHIKTWIFSAIFRAQIKEFSSRTDWRLAIGPTYKYESSIDFRSYSFYQFNGVSNGNSETPLMLQWYSGLRWQPNKKVRWNTGPVLLRCDALFLLSLLPAVSGYHPSFEKGKSF